jgi:hypothetical protein
MLAFNLSSATALVYSTRRPRSHWAARPQAGGVPDALCGCSDAACAFGSQQSRTAHHHVPSSPRPRSATHCFTLAPAVLAVLACLSVSSYRLTTTKCTGDRPRRIRTLTASTSVRPSCSSAVATGWMVRPLVPAATAPTFGACLGTPRIRCERGFASICSQPHIRMHRDANLLINMQGGRHRSMNQRTATGPHRIRTCRHLGDWAQSNLWEYSIHSITVAQGLARTCLSCKPAFVSHDFSRSG